MSSILVSIGAVALIALCWLAQTTKQHPAILQTIINALCSVMKIAVVGVLILSLHQSGGTEDLIRAVTELVTVIGGG